MNFPATTTILAENIYFLHFQFDKKEPQLSGLRLFISTNKLFITLSRAGGFPAWQSATRIRIAGKQCLPFTALAASFHSQ
jgi:hypothetical protein